MIQNRIIYSSSIKSIHFIFVGRISVIPNITSGLPIFDGFRSNCPTKRVKDRGKEERYDVVTAKIPQNGQVQDFSGKPKVTKFARDGYYDFRICAPSAIKTSSLRSLRPPRRDALEI